MKLTVEEKAQRKAERLAFDQQQADRAPYWGRFALAETRTITDAGDVIWLLMAEGRSSIDIEIRRPIDGGLKIDTATIRMSLEDWAQLADAVIRRVRWLRSELNDLDPLVQSALSPVTPDPIARGDA